MFKVCTFFCFFFATLAVASLGHDIWHSYSTGNQFAFSEIGGLFQKYARDVHDEMRAEIAGEIGPRGFNKYFVPVLSLKTILVTGVLSILFSLPILFKIRLSRGKQARAGQTKYKRR